MMAPTARAVLFQFIRFVESSEFLRVIVIPIIMSLLALHYLLEPGFIGFVDYDGLAPSLERYVRTATGHWGFWFAPGASIPLVANLILNDSVTALKVAVFVYQYLAFIIAYRALQVVRALVGYERSPMTDWIVFLLAIGYAFNIYVIGGLFNFFLPQFEMPYIFAPLFFAYIGRLYFRINYGNDLRNRSLLTDALKIAVLGVFVFSSPDTIVMSFIVLAVFLLSIIISTKRPTIVIKSITLFVLIFLASGAYAIFGIFMLPPDDPSMQRFMEGKKPALNGPDMINVLTNSYPSREVSPRIFPEPIFIPSTVFVFLPIVVLFYSSFIVVPKSTPLKKIILNCVLSALLIMVFINGNANDNALSNLLNLFSDHIPKFIFSAFANELVNAQHLFSLIFIGASVTILYFATTISRTKLLVLVLILVVPIVANYYYVQSTFYSKAINPTPVPAYYDDVFRFIREHPNGTSLWLPQFGILEWRGVYMSDIPGFLGRYHQTNFTYVKAGTTDEQFATIVKSLKDQNFPEQLFQKNDIKYIIISTDYIKGHQPNVDAAIEFIKNDASNFKLLHVFGDVLVYEVVYHSIPVSPNLAAGGMDENG